MTALHRRIKYEQCVVCHCTTETPVDTPVNIRKNYICGVGELCNKCFLEVYQSVDPITKEAHIRLTED